MPLSGLRAHRELALRLLAELKARPSHAYLFSGPSGTGKSLVATALAHAMLCERAPGGDFCCSAERCAVRLAPATATRPRTAAPAPRCDCCAACVQVAAGTHPDFIRIGRAAGRSDVLIEQVRALIAQLGVKPSRAGARVAIIDDAETLNLPAQNALLKTLEEPPGHAIIFMITSSERALLDTVRSRMRAVRFGALPPADIEAILTLRGVHDSANRAAAARLARGSAARAIALLDGDAPPMKELLAAIARARTLDFAGAQQIAQDYFKTRDEAAAHFELIARMLEEVLCLKLLGADEIPQAKDEEAKLIKQLAGALADSAIVDCLEAAVKARGAVDAMANPRMQAEQFWMTAAATIRSTGE
ncbi:MAG: DNA polymerase III subunit [Candidatus Binataceae bacterium]